MRMVHVTLTRNLASIKSIGIHLSCSKTAVKAIWCCRPDETMLAFEHVSARHGVPIDELMAVAFEVDEDKVIRYGKTRFYRVKETIPPQALLSFGRLSLVPV